MFLLGLAKTDDSDIWHYARYHGYSLVTKNSDMVDLCILRGAPPKILWLRIGNCTSELALEVLDTNRERIARFEKDETVVLSLFRLSAVD